jgi:hypothetical protein
MSVKVLDSTVASAVTAAATQQTEMEAVVAPFSDGDVRIRYYSASDVLQETVTHNPWIISNTNPRYVQPGTIKARNRSGTSASTYCIVAVPDGADILRIDGLTLSGVTAEAHRTNLGAGSGADGLRVYARSTLPLFSTALQELAAGLSAGEWAELTGVTGFVSSLFPGGTSNTADYMDKGVYDPVNKQIRWIGQAHESRQDWYQYDEATNAFTVLADPPWDTGGSGFPGYLGHGYQHNTVDPATGDQFYRMTGGGTVRAFDRAVGTWSTLPSFQSSGNAIAGAIEWLPSIGTSGGLISALGEYVQRWDKAANSVSTISSSLPGPQNHRFAWHSIPNNIVLFGGGNGDSTSLYSIGASGGITTRADCPIGMGVTIGITVTCPASGDLLVFGSAGAAQQYDVPTDEWSTKSMSGAPSFGTIDADVRIIAMPVPAYGVIVFFFVQAEEVWVHKHKVV